MAVNTKLIYTAYKNMHMLAGKDINDNFISVNEYNTLLEDIYVPFVNSKLTDLLVKGRIPESAIASSGMFTNLIATEDITFGGGELLLTNSGDTTYDMMFWVSARTTAVYSGQIRRISLVPQEEYVDRRSNILAPPPDENPIANLYYDKSTEQQAAYIYPSDITGVTLTYIRRPATPALDYYILSSGRKVFMDVDATADLTALSATYRTGATSGTVNSITEDVEMPEQYHEEFVMKLLEAAEKVKPDYNGVQYTRSKQ